MQALSLTRTVTEPETAGAALHAASIGMLLLMHLLVLLCTLPGHLECYPVLCKFDAYDVCLWAYGPE